MSHRMDRRKFLGAGLGAGATLLTSCASITGSASDSPPAPLSASGPRAFRFVHMTDLHIQPELGADQGVIQALQKIHRLDPRPDFIQLGGDLIMDALGEDASRSRLQFELFRQVMRDHTDLPLRLCIGNHDVFGWEEKHGVGRDHVGYGKAMAFDQLEMERGWYAFDHKGWRFYVLDNIQQDAPESDIRSYQGYIDEEQWAWLEGDLKAKDPATPAIVTCHIPILTVTMFNDWAHRFADRRYTIATAAVCQDAMKLANLFSAYNVRLNLSGHIHQRDRIDLRGVTYICGGAVSGNWWKGPLEGVQEGIGVVDVAPDGGFLYDYLDYGWEARS